MIFRLKIALIVVVLGAALFVPPSHAQRRGGMRVSSAGFRSRGTNLGRGVGIRGRVGFGRLAQRRYFDDPGYLFAPYYYPDDEFGYRPVNEELPPVRVVAAQPAPPPAPAAAPGEPLLMELHDGQWVRVPTGGQMQANPASMKPDPAILSNPRPGIVEVPNAASPLTELPPAVIVFRDGHKEELQKYVIQGDTLYVKADNWSTGSGTKKIPLSELDIPASLKINKERGTKFSLPSGPNEVVVRF